MNNAVKRIKGILYALLYVSVYYAVSFVIYYFFYEWKKMGGATVSKIESDIVNNTFILNIAVCLVCLGIYFVIGKLRDNPLDTVVKREASLPIVYFMSISLAIGCRFLVSVYYYLAQKVNFLEESITNAVSSSPEITNGSQLIIALLCIIVVAPCFEEILFRGLVMGELLKIVRPWVAITLQAVAFGVAHGVLFQSLFTFAVGLILGIVYFRTLNIKVVIMCHMLFNLSTILTQEELQLQGMLVYILSGVLLCGLSMFYIFSNSKKGNRF